MTRDRNSLRFLFCDIDGCLNGGKHVPFDLATLTLIRDRVAALRARGTRVVLVTGRPQPYAEAMAQVIDTAEPLVFENGSGIFDPATGLVEALVTPAQLAAIAQVTQALEDYCRNTDGCALEPGKTLSASLSGPAITSRSVAQIGQLTAKLAARFADAPVSWAHSSTAVDVTAAGTNKWTACQRLIAADGADVAACGAIGDSNGDLPMLRKVGQPMCPANAADEVKALTRFQAPRAYAAGFLDILDHLAGRQG